MEGIIQEGEELISMLESDDVMDAAIITAAQRVEHYEISGYGSAIAHARELGFDQAAEQLQMILDQEYEADSFLTDIAESGINAEADDVESEAINMLA